MFKFKFGIGTKVKAIEKDFFKELSGPVGTVIEHSQMPNGGNIYLVEFMDGSQFPFHEFDLKEYGRPAHAIR
jgi:hypothetical protein